LAKNKARTEKADASVRVPANRTARDKRWPQILEAAAVVFYEKGYDAATLQEIADRTGLLKGSIYYYIDTKSDLLDGLLLDDHRDVLDNVKRLSSIKGTPIETLGNVISGHVKYICNNLVKTTVYLHELKKMDLSQRNKLFDNHEFREIFQGLIEDGQREGQFLSTLEPKMTAQAMLGSVNSLYQWYNPSRSGSIRSLTKHFVSTTLRGIASKKGLEYLDADNTADK
jgi:AcrR family transcriptional regulator